MNRRIINANRNVRNYSPGSKRLIPKKIGGKYYYKIFPEGTIPEKKWCTTFSPIIESVFKEMQDWIPTENLSLVSYTDYSVKSPIKSYFKTRVDITTKIFLAKLLQPSDIVDEPKTCELDNEPKTCELDNAETRDVPEIFEFFPPTAVYYGKKLDHLTIRNRELFEANENEKWFLKPSKGYGGTGIRILTSPKKAYEYFHKKAIGFPVETLERDPKKANSLRAEYVIQKGVQNLLLTSGYKFDIRVWVLFDFNNGQFSSYLYHDGFLRVSSQLYKEESYHPLVNLTNLTYHKDRRSKVSKTQSLQKQSYYDLVFPKIMDATGRVVKRLASHISAKGLKGFEIMGFDYILDTDYNPHLLEINRHIGYPIYARDKTVVKTVYKMFHETIKLAVEPKITGELYETETGWVSLYNWTE